MRQKRRLRRYLAYLKTQSLSLQTITAYYREAASLEAYLKGRKPKKEQVRQFIAEKEKRNKISTVNFYAIAVNRYLKWLNCSHCCVKTRKIQRRWSLENVISCEEYERLFQYAKENNNEKYYLIIRVLARTGIRIGELRYITFESLKRETVQVYGKGKYRTVYLPEDMRAELLKYCNDMGIGAGCIFLGNREKPISRSAVWQMLQKLACGAGIPPEKVHPHSFRHLFAKMYMRQHGNISELADILGHSGLEITRIYLTTSREEKLRRVEELPL